MHLGSDCLFSRVMYENHEYHFFWSMFRIYDHLSGWLNIFNLRRDIKAMTPDQSVDEAGSEAESLNASEGDSLNADFGYKTGADDISYEEFRRIRLKASYWVQAENYAPLWTGEFGNSQKWDNTWWEYTLRLFEEAARSSHSVCFRSRGEQRGGLAAVV